MPRSRSASAAARPPMPAPAISTRRGFPLSMGTSVDGNTRCLDHAGPLLHLGGDDVAKLLGRGPDDFEAGIAELVADLLVAQDGFDVARQALCDRSRGARGRNQAEPAIGFEVHPEGFVYCG